MYTTDVSSACVDTRVRVIKTKVRVIWSGGAYRGVHLIALLRSIQFTRQSKGEAERSAAAHSTKEPSNLFEDLTGIENALSSFMYKNDEGNPPTTRGVVFAIRVIGANNQIVGGKKNLCVDVCFYLRRERALRRLGETSLYLSPHCATHGHHPNFPPLLSLPETAYTGTQSSVDCLSVITSVGTEQPCANLIRKRE